MTTGRLAPTSLATEYPCTAGICDITEPHAARIIVRCRCECADETENWCLSARERYIHEGDIVCTTGRHDYRSLTVWTVKSIP